MVKTNENIKGLNGSELKCIAIFSMLIDHIGATIIQNGILKDYMGLNINIGQPLSTLLTNENIRIWVILYILFRAIGRISFPIFSFLLVEGFIHTKNIKNYIKRLLLFALISEIPFNYVFYGKVLYWEANNVFLTLFISVLVLLFLERIQKNILRIIVIIIGIIVTNLLNSDFATSGVILTTILYLFREQPYKRNVLGIISMCWGITAPLSFIFINLYNGQRGVNLKYIFYVFYPLHLIILGLITNYMF